MIQEGKFRKLVILKRYIFIYQIKDKDVFVDALRVCQLGEKHGKSHRENLLFAP